MKQYANRYIRFICLGFCLSHGFASGIMNPFQVITPEQPLEDIMQHKKETSAINNAGYTALKKLAAKTNLKHIDNKHDLLNAFKQHYKKEISRTKRKALEGVGQPLFDEVIREVIKTLKNDLLKYLNDAENKLLTSLHDALPPKKAKPGKETDTGRPYNTTSQKGKIASDKKEPFIGLSRYAGSTQA